MSFIDVLLGQPPRRFEKRRDPRIAKRNPHERKSLRVHVDEDDIWRDHFGAGIAGLEVEVYGIRKLLLVIVLLLIASKVFDVSALMGLFGG